MPSRIAANVAGACMWSGVLIVAISAFLPNLASSSRKSVNFSAPLKPSEFPLPSNVLRSTSQIATTLPNWAALLESPPPLPPTPMQTTFSFSFAARLTRGLMPPATQNPTPATAVVCKNLRRLVRRDIAHHSQKLE